ncbi:MAG TPA: endolytic transglycosylase MltG [Stackebrandtia sp.]|uniref:endolytic transglycosylase MltG n=1 Tax=Stackebrandtia sp. TaxID=2023065 RepID=UPI002D3545B4|nr:endolytic transglycosylase MltG [Stackebrandtia sp.]HZE39716.1 endolytic transglycosylase MltG [Stackebrandtia sp.]
MLDERSRAGRKSKNPRGHRRKSKGRKALTLLLVVVLLGTVGAVGYFGFDKIKAMFSAADYAGSGNGVKVTVDVPQGSATLIGDALYKKDVVKSSQAFVNAAKANTESTKIQPGTYALQEHMSGASAVEALLDPKNRRVGGVTVREGLTEWETFQTLSKATGVPEKDFETAAKDPEKLGVPDEWFKRTDGKEIKKSVEGFLFPSTYEFSSKNTATQMLKAMVKKFLEVTDDIGFVDTVQSNTDSSPYEVLIVASLAEAEAGVPKDLGKVARVAFNRLSAENFYCSADVTNCLDFDSTTNYGLMLNGGKKKNSKDLTKAELSDKGNEYSTHVHSGLPPTPINSPGKQAMQGAADPPKGKWLYFVAIDKKGNSAFAETKEEHQKNVEKARENGVL